MVESSTHGGKAPTVAWGADASSKPENKISLDHWFARHLCPVLCTFTEILLDAHQDCKLSCDEEGQVSHEEAGEASPAPESETSLQDYSLCDIETELDEDLEPVEQAIYWMLVIIVIFQVSELTLLLMALGKSFFEHILYVLDVVVVGVVCITLIFDLGAEDVFMGSVEATEEEEGEEGERAKKKDKENAQGKNLTRRSGPLFPDCLVAGSWRFSSISLWKPYVTLFELNGRL
eukprot:gene4326-5320_t